jgi:pilus assembly protein FimV
LNAEIGLSLSAGEHLDDIKVTLATPDQFDKLGISWSYFISKIQFKPIVKSNGKVVIKVTSDQILQEPILDFLLEVRCWVTFLATFHKESPLLVGPYSPLTTKLLKPFSCTGVGAARLVCFFGFATDTQLLLSSLMLSQKFRIPVMQILS